MKLIIKISILSFFLLSCIHKATVTYATDKGDSIVTVITQTLAPDFFGCWKPVDYKFGYIYALDSTRVKALMKQVVCLDKDSAVIFGDTMYNTVYTIDKISAEEWVQDIKHETKNGLGITTDSMWNIEVNYQMTSGNYSFWEYGFDGTKLLICIDGIFIWLEREEPVLIKYTGIGTTTKIVNLTGKETFLNLSYEFYTDPDEIIVYDQRGKELYHSVMKSTEQEENVAIKLDNVTKLTIKVNSKAANSRWVFWFSSR